MPCMIVQWEVLNVSNAPLSGGSQGVVQLLFVLVVANLRAIVVLNRYASRWSASRWSTATIASSSDMLLLDYS